MQRYSRFAGWYDVVSGEPVYRAGRQVAIAALGLRPGDRVIDIGCGSGLNFPGLADAVGSEGEVVGVDRSPQMLEVARRKADRTGLRQVRLVQADVTRLTAADVLPRTEAAGPSTGGFDAMIATYALSLMSDPVAAWRTASGLLAPGAHVAVVDMQPPTGAAVWAAPLARLACWLGGADITARPWLPVEAELHDVQRWSLRGGHIQVRVGVTAS